MSEVALNPDQFTDPLWRISNLYSITDKAGKVVPFRPNWAQTEILTGMSRRNIVLKARQLGVTTLMAIVQLDDCLFTPNTRAAIIAHRLDDAKVIFRDKVKFVYDHVDEGLKNAIRAIQDSADTLTLSNNSSFRVSTSTRSGTLQWLHISEYGKICSQYPEKAREIRTGAIPSAESGVITIESTAEGNSGDFYDKAVAALAMQRRGDKPSRLDFKFFFFPWWREPRYQVEQVVSPVSHDDEKYFHKLETVIQEQEGLEEFEFSQPQKNWWVLEENNLGSDMKREYPATPEEAFEQAVEGAYWADQIALAEKRGRIGDFPVDPRYVVNTFWDLGRNDLNTIWLEQFRDGYHTFVGYFENNDEYIGHYVSWLQTWAEDHSVVFGKHYLPHDGDVKSLWLPGGTLAVMRSLNFRPVIVPRVTNKIEAIRATRLKFPMCRFDLVGTKVGLSGLRNYRKKFNEKTEVWSDAPLHDINSHRADSFITFATSGYKPKGGEVKRDFPKDRYRKNRRAMSRGSLTPMSA